MIIFPLASYKQVNMFPLGGGADITDEGGAFVPLGGDYEGGLFGILKNILGLGMYGGDVPQGLIYTSKLGNPFQRHTRAQIKKSGRTIRNPKDGSHVHITSVSRPTPYQAPEGHELMNWNRIKTVRSTRQKQLRKLKGKGMHGGLFGVLKNLLGLGMGSAADEAEIKQRIIDLGLGGGAFMPLGGGDVDMLDMAGDGFFSNLWRKVKNFFSGKKTLVQKGISKLPSFLQDPARGAVKRFGPAVSGFLDRGVSKLPEFLQGPAGQLRDKIGLGYGGGVLPNIPKDTLDFFMPAAKELGLDTVLRRVQRRARSGRTVGRSGKRRKLSGNGYSGGGIVDVL